MRQMTVQANLQYIRRYLSCNYGFLLPSALRCLLSLLSFAQFQFIFWSLPSSGNYFYDSFVSVSLSVTSHACISSIRIHRNLLEIEENVKATVSARHRETNENSMNDFCANTKLIFDASNLISISIE